MLPGFFAAVSLLTSSTPGVTGRKPSGLPPGPSPEVVSWNGKPGRPFSVGPGNGMFPAPKRRSLAPVKSAHPDVCCGPGSKPAATCGLMKLASYFDPTSVTWEFQSSGIEVD